MPPSSPEQRAVFDAMINENEALKGQKQELQTEIGEIPPSTAMDLIQMIQVNAQRLNEKLSKLKNLDHTPKIKMRCCSLLLDTLSLCPA